MCLLKVRRRLAPRVVRKEAWPMTMGVLVLRIPIVKRSSGVLPTLEVN
jgi:hypothetical protein